jgi:hypothetical protein
MAKKRMSRTSASVPKRSVMHNRPIDYNPKSKLLESELEKILAGSSGGKNRASNAKFSDETKELKTFSTRKSN